MAKPKKLIIANWKMNPETPREAKSLFVGMKRKISRLKNVQVIVCPPVIFLGFLNPPKSKLLSLGAQDVSIHKNSGAFTGAISAAQVSYSGALSTIVGHSERRAHGDTDEDINTKIKLALRAGLSVILCVGEKERDYHGDYLETIKSQMINNLSGLKKNDFEKIIFAYEPIWAIGEKAKESDTPESFFQISLFIRKIISDLAGNDMAQKVKVLYGGSANPKNAEGFLGEGLADGLLVGRASLNLDQFNEILDIAENINKKK